ncbi:hypothetical protein [Alkalihalobacillus sp. 1P02AB]|uniref:hypothetical protein n=1 Tax=Alkalihalobacillus sp. 1P02AB TaxID=3132260 RepID=UPI0039A70205
MNKMIKAVGISVLAFGALVACNSEAEESSGNTSQSSDFVDGAEQEGTGEQINIRMGEPVQIDSTIGSFEITLNSLTRIEEFEVRGSANFDYFAIGDFTVKNIGDTDYDAKDMVGAFELTDDVESGGRGGYAIKPEDGLDVEPITGILKPGEETSGAILYPTYDYEQHHLVIKPGLLAAGGIKTEAVITIDKDEWQ